MFYLRNVEKHERTCDFQIFPSFFSRRITKAKKQSVSSKKLFGALSGGCLMKNCCESGGNGIVLNESF